MIEERDYLGREADQAARQIFPQWHQMEKAAELDPEQLDQLPFGAIKLDAEGRILAYNSAEAAISGLPAERVLGKNFFLEVAPCTNVQQFAGRFRDGYRNEDLNHVFPYLFDFEMRPTNVWIRLYYNQNSRSAWVFVTRRRQAGVA